MIADEAKIGRTKGNGRGFVTFPPYGPSSTLDDDIGDIGLVMEARKFRVCR